MPVLLGAGERLQGVDILDQVCFRLGVQVFCQVGGPLGGWGYHGKMQRVCAVSQIASTGTESDGGTSVPFAAFDVLRRRYLCFSMEALR
jgi:hypothetical protein